MGACGSTQDVGDVDGVDPVGKKGALKRRYTQSPKDVSEGTKIEGVEWYKELLPKHSKKLEIIHFNDVYSLEERKVSGVDHTVDCDPRMVGGAARFVTALHQYDSKDKLVIFSGDLFFPSNMSAHYHGE